MNILHGDNRSHRSARRNAPDRKVFLSAVFNVFLIVQVTCLTASNLLAITWPPKVEDLPAGSPSKAANADIPTPGKSACFLGRLSGNSTLTRFEKCRDSNPACQDLIQHHEQLLTIPNPDNGHAIVNEVRIPRVHAHSLWHKICTLSPVHRLSLALRLANRKQGIWRAIAIIVSVT